MIVLVTETEFRRAEDAFQSADGVRCISVPGDESALAMSLALREAGCENHRAGGSEGVAKEGHAGAPMRIEVARYCAANVMKRCSSASPLLSQKSK